MENGKKTQSAILYINRTNGVYTYVDGSKYDGAWDNDKRNGQGITLQRIGLYYYSNGDKYEGNWKDDIKYGKGNFPL